MVCSIDISGSGISGQISINKRLDIMTIHSLDKIVLNKDVCKEAKLE